MKLEPLTGRDAKGIIAELPAKTIKRQINIGLDRPARQTAADHVDELLGDLAFIAVVLLVDAVKFEELVVIL